VQVTGLVEMRVRNGDVSGLYIHEFDFSGDGVFSVPPFSGDNSVLRMLKPTIVGVRHVGYGSEHAVDLTMQLKQPPAIEYFGTFC
jgi:hypothetical protein